MNAGSAVARARGQRFGAGLIVAGVGGLVLVAFVLIVAVAALGGASFETGSEPLEAQSDGVSALAEREIPPLYLRLYEQAARRYGLDWTVLAGIGKVECDHGRSPAPSCTREGAVNAAGAGGPMQFLASTWATYGVDAAGAGSPNRWDPADAIYGAANYLRASGAPSNYERAIFAYNHADWYVAEVERWAWRYSETSTSSGAQAWFASDGAKARAEGSENMEASEGAEAPEGADLRLRGESPTPVRFIAGQHAELDPGDGHLALVPAGVPAVVQAMVVAGNELRGAAVWTRRASRPAGGIRRGLLEHRQLRPLPLRCASARGNPPR